MERWKVYAQYRPEGGNSPEVQMFLDSYQEIKNRRQITQSKVREAFGGCITLNRAAEISTGNFRVLRDDEIVRFAKLCGVSPRCIPNYSKRRKKFSSCGYKLLGLVRGTLDDAMHYGRSFGLDNARWCIAALPSTIDVPDLNVWIDWQMYRCGDHNDTAKRMSYVCGPVAAFARSRKFVERNSKTMREAVRDGA